MSDTESEVLSSIEEESTIEHKTDDEVEVDQVKKKTTKSQISKKKKEAVELFEDPVVGKPKKAKRPLSEERKKQMLANLKKGREKLAAQREQKKKREGVKLDKKIVEKDEMMELKSMIMDLQKQMRSANTKKEKDILKEEVDVLKTQSKASIPSKEKSKPIVNNDVEPAPPLVVVPPPKPKKISNLIKQRKRKGKFI